MEKYYKPNVAVYILKIKGFKRKINFNVYICKPKKTENN